mmetsp:Transcript_84058/g.271737  ORF Transcript_84058/g.271737 Transcript_84058/m.271737 type:complete len:175 (+) Transcript_84058:1-525(+)
MASANVEYSTTKYPASDGEKLVREGRPGKRSKGMREGPPVRAGIEACGVDDVCSGKIEQGHHHMYAAVNACEKGGPLGSHIEACVGDGGWSTVTHKNNHKQRPFREKGGVVEVVEVETPSHTIQLSEPGCFVGVLEVETQSYTTQQHQDIQILQFVLALSWPQAVEVWRTRLKP